MDWHASFNSTLDVELVVVRKVITVKPHYINICACVGNGQILSVMGEAQGVDCMAIRVMRSHGWTPCGQNTYSQQVMVRAHIHSVTSNRFTMESCPPDAMYFPLGS